MPLAARLLCTACESAGTTSPPKAQNMDPDAPLPWSLHSRPWYHSECQQRVSRHTATAPTTLPDTPGRTSPTQSHPAAVAAVERRPSSDTAPHCCSPWHASTRTRWLAWAPGAMPRRLSLQRMPWLCTRDCCHAQGRRSHGNSRHRSSRSKQNQKPESCRCLLLSQPQILAGWLVAGPHNVWRCRWLRLRACSHDLGGALEATARPVAASHSSTWEVEYRYTAKR